MKTNMRQGLIAASIFMIGGGFVLNTAPLEAAQMNDYCIIPPFVTQTVSPLVMLNVGRDHKLYYQAYSDAADLDSDGKLDIDYTHTIDYYGYFDSYKCYTYNSTDSRFDPSATSADKFCASGYWSGNFLNWLTMTRMDALRKVLYGGHRIIDTTAATILRRVYVPQDAHSWGKEFTGRLCKSGTTYTHTCSVNSDCDSGQTCANLDTDSKYLTPLTAADTPTTCTSVAVTGSQAGKILVARYNHASSKSCGTGTSIGLINSYEPENLFHPSTGVANISGTSSMVDYVNGFDDASLNPSNDYADDYNIIAVTNFTPNVSGTWQFAVDGDDDVEIQVNGLTVAQYLGCHGASGGQSHNGYISLNAGTTYTIVARHFEDGGGEGIRAWFKRPGATYTITRATSGTLAGMSCSGGTKSGGNSSGNCRSNAPCYCRPNCASGYTESPDYTNLVQTCMPSNWTPVASTGAGTGEYAPLVLSAPSIAPGNECAIETASFVSTGTPTVGATVVKGSIKQHLFCNTTLSDAGTPIFRVLANNSHRIWDWSAKERPVCDTSLGTPTDYTVNVKVCAAVSPDNRPATKQDSAASGRETNCLGYTSSGVTTYKPTGLLQKYSQGTGSKSCSKNPSKSCSTDIIVSSDCDSGEGLCVYRAPMYFGMISGSYMKNESGGVLRKNLSTMYDEINLGDGTFKTGTEGIINTFENMRIVGYMYRNASNDPVYAYEDTSGGECSWITTGPLPEGKCRSWGNPIGEMLYESLRYFAGKGSATAAFTGGITDGNDSGLNLPLAGWGYTKGATTYQPYDIFPPCAKPFNLILSDINPSYDSDQIPGNSFNSVSEDATLPTLGLGTVTGGFSLLNQLADVIGSREPDTTTPINGNDWFIGQSDATFDTLCTSKEIQYLSKVRGLCPEEPTKRGSYYTAAVAYYGKTMFNAKTGKPNITNYSVAMSSPVADLKIKVGGKIVTLVPTGKSVSGCLDVQQSCIDKCADSSIDGVVGGTAAADGGSGLKIDGCTSDAYCPTNQIVNFYVDNIRYDVSGNVIYALFRINYEDVEQGADHDMDAIVKYEVCTQAAKDAGYGSCTDTLGSDLQVKLNSDYGAGCVDQALGFIISGTTQDGTYLVVKDGDVGSGFVNNLRNNWKKTFTPSSSSASGFLKNPLWYAAKWGGFNNTNGNTNGATVDGSTIIPAPDATSEWAKNDGVNPDNYYLVTNPLLLETQLDKALNDILTKTASGTAASILSNQDNNGALLLQAIFYPTKYFQSQAINWLGELHGLFYYIDPFLLTNSIREDTVTDQILNLRQDDVTRFSFDTASNQTVVQRLIDSDGNGTGDVNDGGFVLPDDLFSVWKAGRSLWSRTSARNIYTAPTSGTTPLAFTTANSGTVYSTTPSTVHLYDLMNLSQTNANTVINFINGTDQSAASFNRSRAATMNVSGTSVSGTWRLGDIVSSTPRILSNVPANTYDIQYPVGYSDYSYSNFIKSHDYMTRNMAFVGANDGMLHAFNLGMMTKANPATDGGVFSISKVTDTNGDGTGADLGKEMWGFIPKNALPYLQYLADPTYNHLYYVDGSPSINDVAINAVNNPSLTPAHTCANPADYWTCDKVTTVDNSNNLVMADTSWRSLLIVGMGLGGASRDTSSTCTDCVKTPISGVGYSSYTAMDVTDPMNPKYLWEFSDPALGFSIPGASIVRIGDNTHNGRWYAIFASGPTGPINTTNHQFTGKSDQTLKIFIVDAKDGTPLRTIDTGAGTTPLISDKAFAGSMANAAIDTDRSSYARPGFYSDDAIYIGYSRQDGSGGSWTKGGVLRILTHEDLDVNNWTVSKVIDGTGPVTSSIGRIQEDPLHYAGNSGKLWLFFGTGRYFYPTDDPSTRQSLYGLAEPCYQNGDIDHSCTTTIPISRTDSDGLQDQTTSITVPDGKLPLGKQGWVIDMAEANAGNSAQRVITDPVPLVNGAVLFTSFKPTSDICSFGGTTSLWATAYNTGAAPPGVALQGQAVIQESTGSFQEVDLHTAFGANGSNDAFNRETASYLGVPPQSPPTFFTKAGMLPQKKILRMQEK